MGQPITVTEKPTGRPGIVRFELNRTLTGMGHEHYASAADATTLSMANLPRGSCHGPGP